MPFGVEYCNMRNFAKLKFYEIRSGNFQIIMVHGHFEDSGAVIIYSTTG